MRPVARSSVTVDLITTREELGELAKLGASLGRDVLIEAAEVGGDGSKVILTSRNDVFLETELACLAAICSLVRDEPVDQVLAAARQMVDKWGFPTEGKPSDNRPLGSGSIDS